MDFHRTLPFKPDVTAGQARAIPASSLAYIGDAVYELFVRSHQLQPIRKIREYHHSVVSYVKAEAQAEIAQKVQPFLTEQEQEIFRRARNTAEGKPKRVSLRTYQQATGLEAVLGFLYLTNTPRLIEILSHCENPHQEG